jgi:hypothetical protein
MTINIQQKRKAELRKVRVAKKKENLLSEEEARFVHACCDILRTNKSERMMKIQMAVMDEGREDSSGMIKMVKSTQRRGRSGNP